MYRGATGTRLWVVFAQYLPQVSRLAMVGVLGPVLQHYELGSGHWLGPVTMAV